MHCRTPDCTNPPHGDGLCRRCYNHDRYARTRKSVAPLRRYGQHTGCQSPDCDRPHHALGFCHLHYNRKWEAENRPPGTGRRIRDSNRVCSEENCGAPFHARDCCSRHYQMLRRREQGVEPMGQGGSLGRQWSDPAQRAVLREAQRQGALKRWARYRAAQTAPR